MAIEEPSVIAAVSGAAKTISESGIECGFVASTSRAVTFAQIQLLEIHNKDIEHVIATVHTPNPSLLPKKVSSSPAPMHSVPACSKEAAES